MVIIILRQLKILNWFKNNSPLIKRDLSKRVVYHYVIKRYIKNSYSREIRLQSSNLIFKSLIFDVGKLILHESRTLHGI